METSRAVSITSTANEEKNSELKGSSGLLGKNGEAAPATSSNQVRSVEKDSNKMKSPSLEEGGDDKGQEIGLMTRLKERWSETITHEESTIPLAWQALLTGLVDALLYGKSTIWTGFQTGNMVQFSQNIAQYMLPGAEKFPLLTLERSLSVLSFLLGSFLGSKGGQRWGDKKRGWQVSSAVIQSIFLFGASAILLSRPEEEPPDFQYWPGVIIMTAFSMGMQSIAAQKLVSPAFATTVAFTATLTQIASDPYLFALTLAPIDKYKAKREVEKQGSDLEEDNGQTMKSSVSKPPKTLGRDRRLMGVFFLCTGAGVAECLLYSRAGCRGGLTVAAGFKMIQAVSGAMFVAGCREKE